MGQDIWQQKGDHSRMNAQGTFGSIHYVGISKAELDRVRLAHDVSKYGHLQSWKELYLYQRTIAHDGQNLEIAALAHRKNNGEAITLPLMNWMKQANIYEPTGR